MAIAKMKKFFAIIPKQDTYRFVRSLQRLSCIEVSEVPDAENMGISTIADEWDYTRQSLQESFDNVEKALKILREYDNTKKSAFSDCDKIDIGWVSDFDMDYSRYDISASTIIDLETNKKQYEAKINTLDSQLVKLDPWMNMTLDFENFPHGYRYIFGSIPNKFSPFTVFDDQTDLQPVINVEQDDGINNYISVICSKYQEREILSKLNECGFIQIDLSFCNKDIKTTYRLLNSKKSELTEKIKNLTTQLIRYVSDIDDLEKYYDILNSRIESLQSIEKIKGTEHTATICGWIPENNLKKVIPLFQKYDCAYSISDPCDEDEVPVLLDNPGLFKPFESVIRLYSLPSYGGFDPTICMSIFYFVIFGFMLADTIYGLILIIGGLLGIKLLHLRGGTKKLVQLFVICGVSCCIAGILTGSYLGDFPSAFAKNILGIQIPSLAILFDPVNEPVTFIIYSVAIGVIHMLFGMGIKFYMLCKEKKFFEAVFDIGSWFVIYSGIGLYFIKPKIGIITAVVGALMVVCTAGRAAKNPIMKGLKGLLGLYDIVGFASDLLSYTRIMALGMASAVIASVINLVATMGGKSIVGIITMVLILIFGTVLNLLINLLGSFVHTSRLQYIEFFGKFYESGGREFKPLTPQLKYTKTEE